MLLLKVKVLLTAKPSANTQGRSLSQGRALQASLISSDESITWALDAETLRRTVGPEFDLSNLSPEPLQKTTGSKEVHYNEERPDMPPWVGKEESLSQYLWRKKKAMKTTGRRPCTQAAQDFQLALLRSWPPRLFGWSRTSSWTKS